MDGTLPTISLCKQVFDSRCATSRGVVTLACMNTVRRNARSLTPLTLVALLALGGCGSKEKESFAPGPMEKYEDKAIGFSIQKPKTVAAAVNGKTVTFAAAGFTTVTVTLSDTEDNHATGSSGGSRGSAFRQEVIVPRRQLVCESKDVGDFAEVVRTMCESLENTMDAPKNPSVKFQEPTITGALTDDSSYTKDLEALRPGIKKCWADVLAKDAKFPSGRIAINITFDSSGAYSKGSNFYGFGRQYDHKPMTSCVLPLVKAVKPTPKESEVKLEWQIEFELY